VPVEWCAWSWYVELAPEAISQDLLPTVSLAANPMHAAAAVDHGKDRRMDT